MGDHSAINPAQNDIAMPHALAHDRIEQPLELRSTRVADDDALVRMEAVVAGSAVWSPQSPMFRSSWC